MVARVLPIVARSKPGAVRELLGDIFVLSYDAAAGYPFRVAGTRVCALLGCDLKDHSFSALFAPGGRREIEDIVAVVSEEMLAAVAALPQRRKAVRWRIWNYCCCPSMLARMRR